MAHYHVEFDYNDDEEGLDAAEVTLTEKQLEEHITEQLTNPFFVELTNFKVTKLK